MAAASRSALLALLAACGLAPALPALGQTPGTFSPKTAIQSALVNQSLGGKADASSPSITGHGLVSDLLHGNKNTACLLGIIAGYGAGAPFAGNYCKLTGTTQNLVGYAQYPASDTAALFVENADPGAALVLVGVTYTTTGVIPPTPLTTAQMALIPVGSYLFTNGVKRHMSAVASVSPLFIGIKDGWSEYGDATPGQNPTGDTIVTDTTHAFMPFGAVGSGTCPGGTTAQATGGQNWCPSVAVNVSSQPETMNLVFEMHDAGGAATVGTGLEIDALGNSGAHADGSRALLIGDGGNPFPMGQGELISGWFHRGLEMQSGSDVQIVCNPQDYSGKRDPATGNTIIAYQAGPCLESWAPSQASGSNDFLHLRPGGLGQPLVFRVDSFGNLYSRSISLSPPGMAVNSTAGSPELQFISYNDGATLSSSIATRVDGSIVFAAPSGATLVMSAPLVLQQQTPASSSAPCVSGQASFDSNFVYTCVATNTWRRVPSTGW